MLFLTDQSPFYCARDLSDDLVKKQMSFVGRLLSQICRDPLYNRPENPAVQATGQMYAPVVGPWAVWAKNLINRNWLMEHFYHIKSEYQIRNDYEWGQTRANPWSGVEDKSYIVGCALDEIYDVAADMEMDSTIGIHFAPPPKHRLYGDFSSAETSEEGYKSLLVNYWAANEPTWSGFGRQRPEWAGGPARRNSLFNQAISLSTL